MQINFQTAPMTADDERWIAEVWATFAKMDRRRRKKLVRKFFAACKAA